MIVQPTLDQQRALIKSLATARLSRFRAVYGGKDRDAVALYLLDAELTSHLHATFRTVEVVIREAMHRGLLQRYGPRWFDNQRILDKGTTDAICDAKRKNNLGKYAPPGKVVAQVMLGTWVGLLDRGSTLVGGGRADYERNLWDPVLINVFSAGGQAPVRQDVHTLALRLNWARNRVNHCEPVVFGFPQRGQTGTKGTQIRRSPSRLLKDAHDLLHLVDPDLAVWLRGWTVVHSLAGDSRVDFALDHVAATIPGVTVQR